MKLAEEQLDTEVGKIQLFRGGSGAPLVYLHSAGGESTLPVLESLADSYDVMVPVFPGFGDSEGIEQIDGVDDVVFHLLDVWDRLGLGAPVVVGTSLGGWLAIELAVHYPERVGRLVVVNPVGLYLEGAPIAEMFGRSPGELADMMFADQGHPIAAAMHAMDEFTGDVGKQVEVPIEMVLPMLTLTHTGAYYPDGTSSDLHKDLARPRRSEHRTRPAGARLPGTRPT